MQVVTNLAQIPAATSPIALTIGIFDGVHQGHQAIIKELHKLTRKGGTRAVLTFSNHPSSIVTPDQPTPLILSLSHRLRLLRKYGINLALVLPFTYALAEPSHEAFLHALYAVFPFNELVLGKGALLGKYWKSFQQGLKAPSQKDHFKIHRIKTKRHGKQAISSHLIRMLIKKCHLQKIKKLMGRPHAIWRQFDPATIGQENAALYTYSFEEKGLCSLPSGVYAVYFEVDDNTTLPAIALLRSERRGVDSHLLITVCFTKRPARGRYVNISFIKYLHSEIDLTPLQPKPPLLLKGLSVKPSLS